MLNLAGKQRNTRLLLFCWSFWPHN